MDLFEPITCKPCKKDKYIYLYNNKSNKGKSKCINGKPTDRECNVLSNCVGWACGRFNHIYNILTGYDGIKYPDFCCNAEKFIEVAQKYGLSIGQDPKPGAIMVWQKGKTLNSSDGAGHVAIVERVLSNTQVITSESGYNSFTFSNKTRSKGSCRRWGTSESYTFRGFIYNPACIEISKEKKASDSSNSSCKSLIETKDSTVNQILVQVDNLRVRKSPGTKSDIVGYASCNTYYTYTKTSSKNGYRWYKIGTDKWIAFDKSWAVLYPAQKFKVNDSVMIVKDAPVYGKDKLFSSWVYNAKLFIRSLNGNKASVSIYKNGSITGCIDKKFLIKI